MREIKSLHGLILEFTDQNEYKNAGTYKIIPGIFVFTYFNLDWTANKHLLFVSNILFTGCCNISCLTTKNLDRLNNNAKGEIPHSRMLY